MAQLRYLDDNGQLQTKTLDVAQFILGRAASCQIIMDDENLKSLALEYLSKVIKRKSVVFMISDFLCDDFVQPLQVANKKHDVVSNG